MPIEYKATHVSEGQDQLITQFVRQPNMRAMLGTWLAQVQEAEDALFQLLGVPEDITAQEGDVLDLIGRIVGQEREGRTDVVYRRWLLGRLQANRASGLPDELMAVLRTILEKNPEYAEFYPASFALRTNCTAEEAADLALLLSEVRAAGVRGDLEYSETTDAETFTFASGDSVEYGGTQGFPIENGTGTEVTNGDFDTWAGDNPLSWFLTLGEDATHEVSEVGSGEARGGSGLGACNIASSGATGIGIFQTVSGLSASGGYCLGIEVSYFSGTVLTVEVKDVPGLATIATLVVTGTGTYSCYFSPTGTQVQVKLTVAGFTQATVDDAQFLVAANYGGVFADVEVI